MLTRSKLMLAGAVGAATIPLIGASCLLGTDSTGAPAPPEELGVARQAIGAGVGASCTGDSDCVANAACWEAGKTARACHCKPDFVACGTACVDWNNDAQNCGGCGAKCAAGQACSAGVCGASVVSGPLSFVVDAGVVHSVSTYDASVGNWANEGYPERGATSPNYLFEANQWTDETDDGGVHFKWNFADAGTGAAAWDTSFKTFGGYSDAWATTSGYSGRDYVSTTGPGCIRMSSNVNANLVDAGWPDTATCINATGEANDYPSCSYDMGGSSLWVTGKRSSDDLMYVYRAPNCTGSIGSATCPVNFNTELDPTAGISGKRASIITNPCTGSAIVSSFDGTSTISLVVVTTSGSHTTCTFATGQPHSKNTQCPDASGNSPYTCGSGSVCRCPGLGTAMDNCVQPSVGGNSDTSCIHSVNHVHLAAQKFVSPPDPTQCRLYAAWDTSVDEGGGKMRFRARLAAIDITNDPPSGSSCGTFIYNLTADPTIWGQTYDSIVTTAQFTPNFTWGNVGWFFFSDADANHCATQFGGVVWSNNNFTNRQRVVVSDSSWPNIVFGLVGGGDYIGIIRYGLPGGLLFPTWTFAKTTTATHGVACNGSLYNEKINGRWISLQ